MMGTMPHPVMPAHAGIHAFFCFGPARRGCRAFARHDALRARHDAVIARHDVVTGKQR